MMTIDGIIALSSSIAALATAVAAFLNMSVVVGTIFRVNFKNSV